ACRLIPYTGRCGCASFPSTERQATRPLWRRKPMTTTATHNGHDTTPIIIEKAPLGQAWACDTSPYGQNIRTRLPTGGCASTIPGALACLPLYTHQRKTTTTWKEFIRTHLDVLVATDFFSAEVWTLGGLVTYRDVLRLVFYASSQPADPCRRRDASSQCPVDDADRPQRHDGGMGLLVCRAVPES